MPVLAVMGPLGGQEILFVLVTSVLAAGVVVVSERRRKRLYRRPWLAVAAASVITDGVGAAVICLFSSPLAVPLALLFGSLMGLVCSPFAIVAYAVVDGVLSDS